MMGVIVDKPCFVLNNILCVLCIVRDDLSQLLPQFFTHYLLYAKYR